MVIICWIAVAELLKLHVRLAITSLQCINNVVAPCFLIIHVQPQQPVILPPAFVVEVLVYLFLLSNSDVLRFLSDMPLPVNHDDEIKALLPILAPG